ncbi:TPA: hypothetical protein QH394_000317 [Klebsiella aerogenes]|uniref:hypothetical protein n=1 Tax=Klebsiella aerogenes TaxID=548 RepID=UPI00277BEAAD|nr:hypothetical protein [Klebsiella aerogenes]
MARLPEAELQHIKAAVPLVAVVKQQGRQMYKRGTKRRTGACGLSAARTRHGLPWEVQRGPGAEPVMTVNGGDGMVDEHSECASGKLG